MKNEKVYATPNRVTPQGPLVFDGSVCKGCNTCVDACQVDVLVPNPDKGGPPVVLFPDECWYCGACVMQCPREGAIRLRLPLTQRVRWKRKGTGEHFRV